MKKYLVLLALLALSLTAVAAQELDLFADLDAVELSTEEMGEVKGGRPRVVTHTIDGDGVGYENMWQANHYSGYNSGDDYCSRGEDAGKHVARVIRATVRTIEYLRDIPLNFAESVADFLEDY